MLSCSWNLTLEFCCTLSDVAAISCDTIDAGVVVYRLSYMYMHVCRHVSTCMYTCVCQYRAETYLHAYVECVGGCMYFAQEPLIQSYEWSRLDKNGTVTYELQSYLTLFGDIQSGNIFMSSLWVGENPEVGNVHPCVYTSKVSLLDRMEIQGWRSVEKMKGR